MTVYAQRRCSHSPVLRAGCSLTQSYGVIIPQLLPELTSHHTAAESLLQIHRKNPLIQLWMGVFITAECLSHHGCWRVAFWKCKQYHEDLIHLVASGSLQICVKLWTLFVAPFTGKLPERIPQLRWRFYTREPRLYEGEYRRRAAGDTLWLRAAKGWAMSAFFPFFSLWAWKTARQLKTGRCK